MVTERKTKQYIVLPAAGKRMIAKAILRVGSIAEALVNGTVVIIAGTTNGYIAEEILTATGQSEGFSRKRFFRGVTLPPRYKVSETGRLEDGSQFPGDVVLVKGKWLRGKTIDDVAESLGKGDVVIKGANAVNLQDMKAAILIGNPRGGTIIPTLQSVVGKRVELYVPVGLEKRISGDIDKIALKLNSPNASGPRYIPVSANIITELQAITLMTGAEAELVAGGGVCGAEGCCWIAVTGTDEQLAMADELWNSVCGEPGFEL